MNVIETIIIIFVLLAVIMTAITEPVLSFQYAKAISKNGAKVYQITANMIKEIKGIEFTINDTDTG